MGWCIMSTRHWVKILPRNTTWRSSALYCCCATKITGFLGKQTICSFKMIMHPSILCIWFRLSWPNTTFLWFAMLHIPLIWLLVTFSCSQSWRKRCKNPGLNHEGALWRTRRSNYTPPPVKSSSNASNFWINDGRSVCCPKKNTLKGFRISDLRVCNIFFLTTRSNRFWRALVYTQETNKSFCQ